MKKLLKENHPDLFKEIHPDKNGDFDYSTLFENSGKKIWWQCRQDKRHIWQQSITNRARKGYGCPYCGRRKTLPEESFGALYPEIASEIHPEKSKDFDPFKYRPGCNKKIWWRCKNGHEWTQIVQHRVRHGRICKICKRKQKSFVVKYPEIAAEWHPTKNEDLLPEDILTSDRRSIWWKCKNNPSHEWEVTVVSRIRYKTGCPLCNRKKEKKVYTTLQEYSYELAQQWHPEKNETLKSSDFKANSSQKIWWICPIDSSHVWRAAIRNRAILKQGCPDCSKNRVTTKNSFLQHYPELAKQWHPTKNGKLKPSDVSYGSAKKIWWQCIKDKSHVWEQQIRVRTQYDHAKCPQCKEVVNNLQKTHPEIALEWHPTKNGALLPNQVSRASGKKVWWKCSVNPDHEWKAVIINRSLGKSGCFHCYKEKTSIRLSESLMDLSHDDIDCYHIFLSNMRSFRKLLNSEIRGDSRLMQPFYRMLYASVITLLEAYLSDAFHKAIMNDSKLFEEFITKNPAFNEKNYKLSVIIDWSKHINKRVSDYLHNEVLWHNMERVEPLYKDVLNIDFPNNLGKIKKAVSIRHDIVHRNGRKKSGGSHKFNKDRLNKLSKDVSEFVATINEQL